MKRLVLLVVLLVVGFQSAVEARGAKRYLKKESTVDMSAAKSISFGWVDLVADDWSVHGYSQREEWETAIAAINNSFQRLAQTKWLPDRTVTGVKDVKDQNLSAQDLHVKFADVRVDYDNYLLYLSIHFFDPKTKAEIASVPLRPYYGNDWGFEKYLKAALDEVNRKIQVEITGVPAGK